MDGIIGTEVYIPQWGESGVVTSFHSDEMCCDVQLGDDPENIAYLPIWFFEVKH